MSRSAVCAACASLASWPISTGRSPPSRGPGGGQHCRPGCIDGQAIVQLKEAKHIDKLAAAYEARINQLQSIDLQRSLAALDSGRAAAPRMVEAAYEQAFCIQSPLRLGISSANASDNHLRSKEQGGKTLNIAVNLQPGQQDRAQPPLEVTARRLAEPQLILRSRSMGFKADFEASKHSSAATVSELFFAYRRSGDEALRLVKQGLVHAGIVRPNSTDVIEDIAAFTNGGGLELTTSSKVLQGSGLGTSGVLSAAILKMLYHLSGHPHAAPRVRVPPASTTKASCSNKASASTAVGRMRAAPAAAPRPSRTSTRRRPTACPRPSARSSPRWTGACSPSESCSSTRGYRARLPAASTSFSTPICRGIASAIQPSASRWPFTTKWWPRCVRAPTPISDGLADRYWQLRCILDPQATNDALQHLFENPQIADLTEGGLLTGAGGGGFALLIAAEGQAAALRARLDKLRQHAAFTKSSVVSYQLNAQGIQLV